MPKPNYDLIAEIFDHGVACDSCSHCYHEEEIYDMGDATVRQSFRYCQVLETGFGECDAAVDLERERQNDE